MATKTVAFVCRWLQRRRTTKTPTLLQRSLFGGNDEFTLMSRKRTPLEQLMNARCK